MTKNESRAVLAAVLDRMRCPQCSAAVRDVGDALACENDHRHRWHDGFLDFSGEPIDAETALRIGLANRIFPPEDLVGAALAAGQKIAARGPLAVALAKRVIQEGQDADVRTAHALEQTAFGLVSASRDCAEGMDAFLAKRDPQFEGR